MLKECNVAIAFATKVKALLPMVCEKTFHFVVPANRNIKSDDLECEHVLHNCETHHL